MNSTIVLNTFRSIGILIFNYCNYLSYVRCPKYFFSGNAHGVLQRLTVKGFTFVILSYTKSRLLQEPSDDSISSNFSRESIPNSNYTFLTLLNEKIVDLNLKSLSEVSQAVLL